MHLPEILEEALHLSPKERYIIVENLLESLNKTDKEIERVWTQESKKRLDAYRRGKIKTLAYKDVFHA